MLLFFCSPFVYRLNFLETCKIISGINNFYCLFLIHTLISSFSNLSNLFEKHITREIFLNILSQNILELQEVVEFVDPEATCDFINKNGCINTIFCTTKKSFHPTTVAIRTGVSFCSSVLISNSKRYLNIIAYC